MINNFARQKIAEYLMEGINPLPHPDEFSVRLDWYYTNDFESLMSVINYCKYLGICYAKGIDVEIEFYRYPPPKEPTELWIEFLQDEGLFLEFSKPIPRGKGKDKVRYEDILCYAFGEIGLLPREFYLMTMAEYTAMATGYFFKRWRGDEHLRTILYNLKSIFRGKKDSMPSSLEAFYPLPSDIKQLSFMTNDDAKEMWKAIKAHENLQLQS